MSIQIKKQYQIVVSGKVQMVRFRERADDLADEFELTGYVVNFRQKQIFILVEGDETDLIRFCDAIRISPAPIKVKEILVSEHVYEGIYDEFVIKREEYPEELLERFVIPV